MKTKLRIGIFGGAVMLFGTLFISSCTVKYASVTNNPVGNKEGEAKASIFKMDQDFSQHRAAKSGGIQHIGVVQEEYALFFNRTVVSGE